METIRLANALAGLIGMGFIFGLGKTIVNRWVGLAAAGLAGMSFWLILQERAVIGGGLVFPLMAGALFGLGRVWMNGMGDISAVCACSRVGFDEQ